MPTDTTSYRTYTKAEAQAALAYVSTIAEDIKTHYANRVMLEHLLSETPADAKERDQYTRALNMHDSAIDRYEDELDRMGLYCTDRTLGQICFPTADANSVWSWRVGMVRHVFLISAQVTDPDVDGEDE